MNDEVNHEGKTSQRLPKGQKINLGPKVKIIDGGKHDAKTADEKFEEMREIFGDATFIKHLLIHQRCSLKHGAAYVKMPTLARIQLYDRVKVIRMLTKLPQSHFFKADPNRLINEIPTSRARRYLFVLIVKNDRDKSALSSISESRQDQECSSERARAQIGIESTSTAKISQQRIAQNRQQQLKRIKSES